MNDINDFEAQYAEARMWCELLRAAGYDTEYQPNIDMPTPFDKEWQVWTRGEDSKRIATISIDGCGASWAGDNALYRKVIGIQN